MFNNIDNTGSNCGYQIRVVSLQGQIPFYLYVQRTESAHFEDIPCRWRPCSDHFHWTILIVVESAILAIVIQLGLLLNHKATGVAAFSSLRLLDVSILPIDATC
jgi:hypothetical protein